MAINNLNNYNKTTDGFDMPLNIHRSNPDPLDNSSVWQSLDAAEDYAKNDPTAYVGQVLTVVTNDGTEENPSYSSKVYVINDAAGTLKETGGGYVIAGQKADVAIGDKATAEGSDTAASGENSHAEGLNTFAGAIGYYYNYFNYSKKYFYLSSTQRTPTNGTSDTVNSNFSCAFNVGDIVCITTAKQTYYNCEIKEINGNRLSFVKSPISSFSSSDLIKPKTKRDYAIYLQNSQLVGTNSLSDGSHAEGVNTTAIGNYSHTEGISTQAHGDYSHAEGNYTQAIGLNAHASGYQTTAFGDNSHAEGYSQSTAFSIIDKEKWCTSTTSQISTIKTAWDYDTNSIIGDYNNFSMAYGNNSHVEGDCCIALGSNSHAEGRCTAAVGSDSHAEGYHCYAEDSYAHAEGRDTKASGSASHAEGSDTAASGDYSHAEGYGTAAIGNHSHASGYNTTAFGERSHAEGYSYSTAASKLSAANIELKAVSSRPSTEEAEYLAKLRSTWENARDYSYGYGFSLAYGDNSHVEGESCYAEGECAHAEGLYTCAIGDYSHAEGYWTNAKGTYAHAEGSNTKATGDSAHAAGYYTEAGAYQYVIGKFNATKTGGYFNGTTGSAFIIGNGSSSTSTLSNAFRVQYDGNVYTYNASGKYNTSGADYAEFFEWLDHNPDSEDRRGYFVTTEGEKIKIAKPGDYILGIISGQPAIIGNSDEDWCGRYIRDEFGAAIKEEFEYEEKTIDNKTGEEKTIVKTGTRYKENPDYDQNMPYIQRADRPEWDAVGMMGVLSVRDDGTCQVNGYCTVAEGGIATASESGYRVIKRVNDHIVKVIFR